MIKKYIQILIFDEYSIMRAIVKVRVVNGSKFLAIPKDLLEMIQANYMAVKLDDSGRLVYTPVSEAI